MAIAFKSLSTGGKWDALDASNADESSVALFGSLPDADRHRELLDRLFARSTTEDGLDRARLLRIDQEAWGITDED